MSTSNFVHVNRPVTRSDNFIGREEIMKYITNGIKHSESIYFALVGELGMGKTSILNNLCFKETQSKYDLPDNILFVMVEPLDRSASGEEFYRYIAESIVSAVENKRSVPDELVEYMYESVEKMYSFNVKMRIERTLTSLLKRFLEYDIKIVLLLDDFEKTVQTSKLDYAEFDYLRSLTNFNINVSFIITSRKDLEFISEAANLSGFSYIFNSTIPYKPIFEKEEVNIFIDRYLAPLDLDDKEKDYIATLSGGVPTLLRFICSKVIELKAEDHTFDHSRLTSALLWEKDGYLRSVVEKNEEELSLILTSRNQTKLELYDRNRAFTQLTTLGIVKSEEPLLFTSPIFEMYIQEWWERQQALNEANSTEVIIHAEPDLLAGRLRTMPNQDPEFANKNQMHELMQIVLEAVKYGRETNGEDVTKQLGEKMEDLEGRLNNRFEHVEETMSEQVKELREQLAQSFVDLGEQYLSPENEDIASYASKIREQAVLLLKNDQYVTYSADIEKELQHVWGLLENESKEYIMIAEILQLLFDENTMDFSPVSICYCRAFELELNRKMLPFLKSVAATVEVRVGHRNLPLADPSIEHLMLGGYFMVIAKSDRASLIRSTMKNSGIDDKQFLRSFNKLKDIRNRTAHADRIELTDIESLKTHLLGIESKQGVLKNLQVI